MSSLGPTIESGGEPGLGDGGLGQLWRGGAPAPWLAALIAVVVVAAGLALALLPPATSLWLVFGAGLVALILARPISGLYLLPFAIAFGSLDDVSMRGVHVGPTDLLVGAIALAWLLRAAASARQFPFAQPAAAVSSVRRWARREPIRATVFAGLLAYLAVVTLSLAVASDRAATLKEMLKWSEVAAVVALGAWQLVDLRRLRRLAWLTITAGLLEAFVGYSQWVMGGDDRVLGTFAQPNPFAGFLNFALALALALTLFSPDVAERWTAAAAAALLGTGALFARSRGATLGLLAAVGVLVTVGYHRERLVAWAAAIAAPLAAIAWVAHLVPRSVQQTVLSTFNLSDAALCGQVNDANFSTMERLGHWAAGIRMFLAHPLLGVGAGNYDAAYTRYESPCWLDPLGHAHNYYITAAAETGILGLAAFLALTGATFAVGWWAARAPGDSGGWGIRRASIRPESAQTSLARALALGFFAALVALAVHNTFDDLFVHGMELQFALCLAALLRLGVLSRGGG